MKSVANLAPGPARAEANTSPEALLFLQVGGDSRIGEGHIAEGKPNQDAHFPYRLEDSTGANIVADGVSNDPDGEKISSITARSLGTKFGENLEKGMPLGEAVLDALDGAGEDLFAAYKGGKMDLNAACTISGVFYDPKKAREELKTKGHVRSLVLGLGDSTFAKVLPDGTFSAPIVERHEDPDTGHLTTWFGINRPAGPALKWHNLEAGSTHLNYSDGFEEGLRIKGQAYARDRYRHLPEHEAHARAQQDIAAECSMILKGARTDPKGTARLLIEYSGGHNFDDTTLQVIYTPTLAELGEPAVPAPKKPAAPQESPTTMTRPRVRHEAVTRTPDRMQTAATFVGPTVSRVAVITPLMSIREYHGHAPDTHRQPGSVHIVASPEASTRISLRPGRGTVRVERTTTSIAN